MKELLLDTALPHSVTTQKQQNLLPWLAVQLGRPAGELMPELPVVRLFVLGLVFRFISKQWNITGTITDN